MNSLFLCIVFIAAAVLWAAICEFRNDNPRDAKLLAGVGSSSLAAGLGAWLI